MSSEHVDGPIALTSITLKSRSSAIGASALIAALVLTLGIVNASAGQHTPFDLKTRVSAKLTLKRAQDGSTTARAVFESKYPECITPNRIRFHGGSEPTPELYYFQFPKAAGFAEAGDVHIRLPRVSEHTYEVEVPGNTLVPAVFFNEAKHNRELRQEPIRNATYVSFLARTQNADLKIKRHGKSFILRCIGSQTEDAKTPLLGE